MKVIIENISILKDRIKTFIETSKEILINRQDFKWSAFEMKNGKCKRVTLKTAKKRFEAQFVDRYQKALDCLNSNLFSNADWIDLRDVLYHTCFQIDLLGEKSYKALRESKKDIIIESRGDNLTFNKSIQVHRHFM